jgi:hypothetical protein
MSTVSPAETGENANKVGEEVTVVVEEEEMEETKMLKAARQSESRFFFLARAGTAPKDEI